MAEQGVWGGNEDRGGGSAVHAFRGWFLTLLVAYRFHPATGISSFQKFPRPSLLEGGMIGNVWRVRRVSDSLVRFVVFLSRSCLGLLVLPCPLAPLAPMFSMPHSSEGSPAAVTVFRAHDSRGALIWEPCAARAVWRRLSGQKWIRSGSGLHHKRNRIMRDAEAFRGPSNRWTATRGVRPVRP